MRKWVDTSRTSKEWRLASCGRPDYRDRHYRRTEARREVGRGRDLGDRPIHRVGRSMNLLNRAKDRSGKRRTATTGRSGSAAPSTPHHDQAPCEAARLDPSEMKKQLRAGGPTLKTIDAANAANLTGGNR
jgi:hypothetical protein